MDVVRGPGPQGWSIGQQAMFCVHLSVTVTQLIYT